MHQRSGSWTQPLPLPSPHHGAHHQRSGSWNGGVGGRVHSFSFNPLPGATISRPADARAFDNSRSGSGYWGEQMIPPPPPGAYGGAGYTSGGSTGPYRQIPSPSQSVKRDTSNQNETFETKPSKVKRAALNRDQSATSNRLKQECMPEYYSQQMQAVQETTAQLRLSPGPDRFLQPLDNAKPKALGEDGRTSTVDYIMEGLGLDDSNSIINTDNRSTMLAAFPEKRVMDTGPEIGRAHV